MTDVSQLTESQRALRVVARDLAESELRPHAAQWDETERFPDRSWDLIREAGLLGLTMPTEFGGSGHGVLEACVVIEEIARGCLAERDGAADERQRAAAGDPLTGQR